jgi:hypothetical protein
MFVELLEHEKRRLPIVHGANLTLEVNDKKVSDILSDLEEVDHNSSSAYVTMLASEERSM